MRELVYDGDAKPLIIKNFPEVKIRDASDEIHVGRFEIELDDEKEESFYIFAIKEGFVLNCLAWQLMIQDDIEKCKTISKKAGIEDI